MPSTPRRSLGHWKSSRPVSYDIDAAFADLDKFYPGSKRPRREAPAAPRQGIESWDANPIVKLRNGVETEFFLITALAAALGKSVITVRYWERKGFIPKAPFRLPGRKNDSGLTGKRVYTRPLIEIAVSEFGKRGLLDAERVEWKHHEDLTIEIYGQWNTTLETAN